MKRLEAPYTIEFMMRQLPRSLRRPGLLTLLSREGGLRRGQNHPRHYKWNSLGFKRGMENIYLNTSIFPFSSIPFQWSNSKLKYEQGIG